MSAVSDIEYPSRDAFSAERHLSLLRAKLIARYKLKQNGGKPEELIPIGDRSAGADTPGVSTGYASGQIRIRLMYGRDWLASADFHVGEIDWMRVCAILDPHFGWTPPGFQGKTPPIREYGD